MEAKLLFKRTQRKAVNMLSLFFFPPLPLQHTYIHTNSHKLILQEVVRGLERERCMIRIVMDAQNGGTGAAGRQVSGLRGRMAEVQGYMAACLIWGSVATALGLLRLDLGCSD